MRLEHGVDGYGHGAHLDRAKEAIDKLRSIEQQYRGPLFLADVQLLQHVAGAVDPLEKLAVAHALIAALKCDLLAAAFADVAIDKIARHIKYGGQLDHFFEISSGARDPYEL